MSGLKIVVIGGGSSYTPELIEGLLNRYHEMPVASLWLVDIEEGKEKVEIIAGLARRMIAKAGLTIEVVATLDRESALRDADFVCSQFRAGCLDARISDERISLRYGLIGQETNGLGGFANACRTIVASWCERTSTAMSPGCTGLSSISASPLRASDSTAWIAATQA